MINEIGSATIITIIFSLSVATYVYADHTNQTVFIQSQKGGSVSVNEFPPTHYTNDTNRTLELTINVDGISDDQLREIAFDGVKDFTVSAIGNIFWYKQVFPLLHLTDNGTAKIPLDDGRLDSYRVCVHFLNYENDNECVGINTAKNITSKAVDMTNELEYVHKDILKEKEENGEDLSYED